MIIDNELKQRVDSVFSYLQINDIVGAVSSFRKLLSSEQISSFSADVDSIEQDYELVLSYMRQGGQDPQRVEIFNSIIRRLNTLLLNFSMQWTVRRYSAFSECAMKSGMTELSSEEIRKTLEEFVSEKALLTLESETSREEKQKEIERNHFDFINLVFRKLVISGQWNEEEKQTYSDMLLTPTIDSLDSNVMLSAITLSLFQVDDYNKFACLVKIYRETTDEMLRQRALVGWAFAISHYPKFIEEHEKDIFVPLLEDEKVRKDLLSLQEQVFYCEDAEKDQEDIRKNIMPSIIKGQNKNMRHFGNIDVDIESLDDILHPDESEKMMEDIEANVKRMQDMQRKGRDIYFGGFAQMKRFGFFYSLVNWFIPFYIDHPELIHAVNDIGDKTILSKLLSATPFCDSDKYSFAFAISHVFKSLPQNIRQMMIDGEIQSASLFDENMNSPEFIRRIYLQNLYRFYMLSPVKEQFVNPFDSSSESKGIFSKSKFFFTGLACYPVMSDVVIRLGKFLIKRKNYTLLSVLLDKVPYNSNDILMLRSVSANHAHDYKLVKEYMKQVLADDGDNLAAMTQLAHACFCLKEYEESAKIYSKVSILKPDDMKLLMYFCISLINSGEAQKSFTYLNKLSFQYPDDMNISRTIAWGYLMLSDYEKAEYRYQKILISDESTKEDYLNAGYCSWFAGDIITAIKRFKSTKSLLEDDNDSSSSLYKLFLEDKDVILSKGIVMEEIRMMSDV